MKTPLSLMMLLLLSACTPKEHVTSSLNLTQGIHKKQTSSADLIAVKGQPESKTASKLKTGATMYEYQGGDVYQIENDKVVAQFRKPTVEEKSLNYWRNKFQHVKTTYLLDENRNPHKNIYVLRASSVGTLVVYDQQKDEVIEIMEHDEK